ncbi:MAG: hypothetical protein EZS28_039923 [Streblomastix strix]|uniref:Uncharacterized protein n=1 Tax=Streblomastix strix TaxID=222440 RepID=A0A5J4U2M7_9EUKA|nr:MAG: hypothetical protein EZS28_039923 [Streblomastix strix]
MKHLMILKIQKLTNCAALVPFFRAVRCFYLAKMHLAHQTPQLVDPKKKEKKKDEKEKENKKRHSEIKRQRKRKLETKRKRK